jgi:hypothetical protein
LRVCSSREKNNSPQLDCSGGDDRISEKCIPLENEIQKAMAMLENEKSSEQSKLVCGDQFSVRKNENVVTKSWPVTAPGSQGVFRGRGRGFGFLKKWAPGSYCLELVVACPAAGTSAQILLVEGK